MPRYKQSYGDVFKVEIRGIQQATSNLKKLDQKIKRSIVGKSVRAGSKPIREAAKRAAPVKTGAMRSGIRTSVRTFRNYGSIVGKTTIRSTKSQKAKGKDAWYAHIVIGGSKQHLIRMGKPSFSDHPYSVIHHPGNKPNDFMWRAARQSATTAIKTFMQKYGPEVENATKALPK